MSQDIKKVLVVDDSSAVRQLLKMLLSRGLSCRVSEAEDGIKAVEQLGRDSFDLILTDINMPRMDGLTLIEQVRTRMALSVPIIILTTKGGETDRDRGLSLGANTYLTKPFNGGVLMDAVSGLAN